MAYSGYLIKSGNDILSMKYMKAETYKITPNQRQDIDSTRNANGVLIRTTLDHTATKIEFETPFMNNVKLQELLTFFRTHFSTSIERKISITYYDMETDTYKTSDFYMPDVTYTIYHANATEIKYNPIRFAFIEY